MNNLKIYITNDGIGVIDAPIEPDCLNYYIKTVYHLRIIEEYQSALAKAKEGVVLFKEHDSDLVFILLNLPDNFSEHHFADTIHDIPIGYGVEVGWRCSDCGSVSGYNMLGDGCKKETNCSINNGVEEVAILKKLPPENSDQKENNMEDFKKFSLLKETPTTVTDNTVTHIPDGTFMTDGIGNQYEYKDGKPVLIHSLLGMPLPANKSAEEILNLEMLKRVCYHFAGQVAVGYDFNPDITFERVWKQWLADGKIFPWGYHKDTSKEVVKLSDILNSEAMQEHASNVAKEEYLLGKTIRYRYIDWDINSYTPWSKCGASDLKKLDDKAIESVEIKW